MLERYGFTFRACGKHQQEISWRVERRVADAMTGAAKDPDQGATTAKQGRRSRPTGQEVDLTQL
jgi:hypothetical protein